MTDTAASLACVLAQTEREPITPPDQITMYRRCACMKLPGRACPACLEQKWLKICCDCFGLGRLYKQARLGGQERTEKCGKCSGAGTIPCPRVEIPLAEEEERAIAMGAENPLLMEKLEEDQADQADQADQPKPRGRGRQKSEPATAVISAVVENQE